MTSSEYFWAWLVYLGGALVVFSLWCWWTRRLPWREARHILRLLVAVFLFMPWYTDTEQSFLSPAWIVTLGDAFTQSPDAAWRAGTVLILGLTSALAISLLLYLALWIRARRAQ
jgi:energy-coupling factor transporter transmembrane protein EcfT